HFALKVTFAAMFCYIVYEAIDWSGIHTAFITCTFIALESTEATLYKGTLRIVGCVIGGALALFSIVFLMPHMETIASLAVLVACLLERQLAIVFEIVRQLMCRLIKLHVVRAGHDHHDHSVKRRRLV